jgi:hypothetical protein
MVLYFIHFKNILSHGTLNYAHIFDTMPKYSFMMNMQVNWLKLNDSFTD